MNARVTVYWDLGDEYDSYEASLWQRTIHTTLWRHTISATPGGKAITLSNLAMNESEKIFNMGHHMRTPSGAIDIVAPSRISGIYVEEV